MRITKVDIPECPNCGLKDILMERLGRTVILAGKNGAGKTRLLAKLENWLNEGAWPYENKPAFKKRLESKIKDTASAGWWKNPSILDQLRTEYSSKEHQALIDLSYANFFDLEFDGEDRPQIIQFVPKQIALLDSGQTTQEDLLQRAATVERIGVKGLAENTLSRIQVIQNRSWNAKHPDSKVQDEEKEDAIAKYSGLNAMIRRFLGEELGRNLDDQATLFGVPIGKVALSDGQKILLQFCAAVHAQADKLSELIVLMDEPENHLHPGAMLDAITVIEKALTKGQLWIATHSIPLLAHFDPDCIWWMEDGTIQHAGSRPQLVLNGLLGDDARIERLGDFLGLPAALAANHFAHQCLLPPNVVGAASNDAQTGQIARILGKHLPEKTLRVLDFGAGRGRLVSALRESGAAIEDLRARFDYRAYDYSSSHRDECEAAIGRLYSNAEDRYFTSEKDIRGKLNPASVDVVVMCNVLHEIDPLEWLELFSAQGLIRHLLCSDGFLLLVEDMEMRIGEKAHQRGFLVLDTSELKTLFEIKEDDAGFAMNDARSDGRLKAHLLPASCLSRATPATLRNTIEQIRHLACLEIKSLRQKPADYRSGRLHALYVHQLANATLALNGLGG